MSIVDKVVKRSNHLRNSVYGGISVYEWAKIAAKWLRGEVDYQDIAIAIYPDKASADGIVRGSYYSTVHTGVLRGVEYMYRNNELVMTPPTNH